MTTFEWILRSEGWFFWLQTPLAILMLTLVLSAFDLTRQSVVMPRRLRRLLEEALRKTRSTLAVEEALETSNAPLARVFRAGFEACCKGQSRADAAAAAGSACEGIALAMERRLTWISTLAHVSMSTGLLGTVWGLVGSFTVIADGGEAPPPHELAAGVSMALVTTIYGLFTAIPGLFAHGLLQPMSNGLLHNLEETSHAMLEECSQLLDVPVSSAADVPYE